MQYCGIPRSLCVSVLLLLDSVASVGGRLSRVSVSSGAICIDFLGAFLLGMKRRTKLGKGCSAL